MWTHRYEHETEVSVDRLWTVIADVGNWPSIDANIDRLIIEEEPRQGSRFKLKPKGAPTLTFTIDTFRPPLEYADLCKMPGAKMKTIHRFEPSQGGKTLIVVLITISGPLSAIWGRTVGKKHASGLPNQTKMFIEAARRLNQTIPEA